MEVIYYSESLDNFVFIWTDPDSSIQTEFGTDKFNINDFRELQANLKLTYISTQYKYDEF